MLVNKTLDFRVVTPLFLGGVDPRSQPPQAKQDTQIRLRPILAMWRYWFRALKGAEIGTDRAGLTKIAKQEQELFGGVRGDHATAAAFRASLGGIDNLKHLDYTEQPGHKDSYGRYLGYGLQRQNHEDGSTDPQRWAITPKTTFSVNLLIENSRWPELERAIDTWVHSGGLGARHRRGWGCIEWTNRTVVGNYFDWLAEHMEKSKAMPSEPEFDVFHPDWCRIKLCERPFTSVEEALTAIRNQLRIDADQPKAKSLLNSRLGTSGRTPVVLAEPTPVPGLNLGSRGYGWRQRWEGGWHLSGKRDRDTKLFRFAFYEARDHDDADKARWHKKGSRVIQNAAFGLPVAYPTWHMTIQPEENSKPIRRPSPVCFRVFRSGTDYRVAVLLFKSRFLPRGSEITANGEVIPWPSLWDDLDNFFNACDGEVVFGRK